ncbi:hypothetical protein FSP39_004285, partial [Pinctada imbricata]
QLKNTQHSFTKSMHFHSNVPRSKFNRSMYQPQSQRSTSVTAGHVTRHMSVRRTTVKKSLMNSNNYTPSEFPISEEVIKAITTFCFPDGMKIYEEKKDCYTHFLVLTDIQGNKTYATCLTFYRSFIVEKDGDGNEYVSLEASNSTLTKGQYRCYIPHCCVLISKYPYFTVMKDCLSLMVHRIEQGPPDDMYQHIKVFTHVLTWTPAPPAGKVAIEVNLSEVPFVIHPPQNADKPVIDIPLYLVFLCLPPQEILHVISAMLVEQRIVFMSSSYAMLTTAMESFLNFILPFQWTYTYVPILSNESLEFLEAPGTFMMGCHSTHKNQVEQIEGLVVVDLDEGVVTCNLEGDVDSQSRNSSENGSMCEMMDIPEIPEESANLFLKVCKKARVYFDVDEVRRPCPFDVDAERRRKQKKIKALNEEITSGCLELMVNLFRGVVSEIRVDLKKFNKQAFLDSKVATEKTFYEKVTKTEMFRRFLKDRMNDKTDYWVEMEVKTRPQSNISESNPSLPKRRPLRKVSSVASFPSLAASREMKIFKMCSIGDSVVGYIMKTLRDLHKALQMSQSYQERASYTYLIGMFRLADNKRLQALEDLVSLAAIDSNLLPHRLIRQLASQIDEKDLLKLKSKPSCQNLEELLGNSLKDSMYGKKYDDSVEIPKRDLFYNEFADIVCLLEMTDDYDTIGRLFTALLPAHLHQNYVDQETFEAFCHCWKENNENCLSLNVDEGMLLESECILKLTSLCKTDFGTGRVALTDKRLCFVKDISTEVKEIIKLRDIKELEKKTQTSLLKQVKVLKVRGQGGFKFTAWLKEERDHFWLLVEEMWAGKVVSIETKDIHAIQKAAQNVLLIDAVITSGQEECTAHHGNEEAIKCLCFYKNYRDSGQHQLPEDTKDTLQKRLDPNFGERERKSVHALLYTPGIPDQGISPRLWVGLGDGKIKVYNAAQWTLEAEFVQTKQSVTCLVAIDRRHVWAGSYGIFIIDIETIRSNKTLMDHQEIVMDIVAVDDGNYAFTASIDGVIMKWDVQKLTLCQEPIKLAGISDLRSLKYHEDQLWCGTWTSVLRVDLTGSILESYQYCTNSNAEKPIEIDSFRILDNNEIWAGCRREGKIIIWQKGHTKNSEVVVKELKCRGISDMVEQENRVWIGSKDGKIYLINSDTKNQIKVLTAHDDAVRSLCNAEGRYILSGSGK